jgi:hypothetical protein
MFLGLDEGMSAYYGCLFYVTDHSIIKRICPGMNLVDASIWLLIVNMLATLDITKPVDENGDVVEQEIIFNNSIFRLDSLHTQSGFVLMITRTPEVFKCRIHPRSEQARKLIVACEDKS